MSDSVSARDDIPTIFVRSFFCRTHATCLTLPALVYSKWRTETGSSYKLVKEIDINVISAAVHSFRATGSLYQPRPTLENNIR